MKVIIVGLGKFGKKVLQSLVREGHDVTVIDKQDEKVQSIVNRYDVMGLCGNGCVSENLTEARVQHADLLIAVSSSDEENVLCCLMAKKMGVKNVIARVRNPEYSEQAEFMQDELGIDRLINPEKALAEEISRILRFPTADKIYQFADGKVEIVEKELSKDSPLIGKSLLEINQEDKKFSLLIVAVEREGKIIIPNGETVLQAGDVISICAKHYDITNFFRRNHSLKQKVDYVMILGADNRAFYLANSLQKKNFRVKIISPDRERCEIVRDLLDNVSVICSDYSDREALESAGIADADAVATMTGLDENNIMLSLFAKDKGVSKVVTVLRNEFYQEICKTLDLDTVVSPYDVVAEDTVRYLRSISVPSDSRIVAMYKIANDKAEVMQFNVNGHPAFSGKCIKDLRGLRSGILITALIRKGEMIVPRGDTLIDGDDAMIIISAPENVISSLDDTLRS